MKRYALSEWIQIDRSIARSINIERDVNDNALLERFQVTPTACRVLERFAGAWEGEKVNAWSLTGPYGTGKSSFCHFLLSMTCGDTETRDLCVRKVQNANIDLGKRLKEIFWAKENLFPAIQVRAVSRYEPLNKTVSRSLWQTLETIVVKEKDTQIEKLYKQAQTLEKKEWPPTNSLMRLVSRMNQVLGKPIFIAVDELGKNLEYQAHHPELGDIYLLQALAEMKEVFLWVCLHQAFGVYSTALTRIQKEEWQKVQGRFEDISYVEPPTRSFDLVKEALFCKASTDVITVELEKWSETIVKSLEDLAIQGFPPLEHEDILKLYPFHPLSVFLLGEMSRRFGQNDRTIFSFLSSGEPHAFYSFLQSAETTGRESLPTLGLDVLYDYFCTNGNLKHSGRTENQRLLEVQYIIASQGDKKPSELKLLKTIGVLNLLSGLPGIVASKRLIHAAMCSEYYKTSREITRQLERYVDKKILLYREYADEFRLWEGSDFDLDKETLEAKGRVSLRSVPETLGKTVPREPIIASRHSLQTGTLRKFEVRWCTEQDIPKLLDRPRADKADGTLWLMVGRSAAPEKILKVAQSSQPVVVAYSPCYEQVRQLLVDAAASIEVCMAPELERDGVARREAKYRAKQAIETLEDFLDRTFYPGSDTVQWFALGSKSEVPSKRELSKLLSKVCDAVYHKCPPIRNEMLNSDKLTSQAAAARNRVAEAMANSPMVENLGFSGFGPEVAIYRSVIKNGGLHREKEPGIWELSQPDPLSQPELSYLWAVFDELLTDADRKGEIVPLKKVLEVFQKPPFGLREGPAMLFIAHYLLANSDEVAVYEGKAFKPFFGDAEILLLLRRPELFSLRSYKPTGLRSQVIRTYAQVINTDLELTEKIRNQTILSVVAPLTEFIKTLPKYTQTTRSLSANALRLRAAIANARDPQELLYKEIPKALVLQPIEGKEPEKGNNVETATFQKNLWAALVELRDAFDKFLTEIKGRFITAMSYEQGSSVPLHVLRNELGKKAMEVSDICFDSSFKTVLLAVASQREDDEAWLHKIASIVMKKRIEHWQDNDLEEWTFRTKDLKDRLNHLFDLKKIVKEDAVIEPGLRLISVTRPDGKLLRKIMTSPKKDKETTKLKERLREVDKTKRLKYLACLVEIMEKEGDFS